MMVWINVSFRTALLAALLVVPAGLRARMLTVDPVFEPYAERTEFSVRRALNYLMRSQREDGTFPGANGDTAGVVAVAGMSFLAAGYTPNSWTPEGLTIIKCAEYCVKRQKVNGYMGDDGGRMYSHCAATLFLSEISGMVEPAFQERLKPVLASATQLILAAQAVKKKSPVNQGGWRYQPNSTDSDTSLTGWAIMSLRASRLNGAPVPDSAIKNAMIYLRNQSSGNGSFKYSPDQGTGIGTTGVALLCMELCGMHGQDITVKAGDYLYAEVKSFEHCNFREYGTYYAAQAMFQLGDKYWKKYADWMYPFWLGIQVEDGSWTGTSEGCPAYVTSMVVLALTVPYRQLPIYQRDETVDEY